MNIDTSSTTGAGKAPDTASYSSSDSGNKLLGKDIVQGDNNIASNLPLEPEEYTNVDQAMVYAKVYKQNVRYSSATSFICFDGRYWRENSLRAQELTQILTHNQLEEVDAVLEKVEAKMSSSGIRDMLNTLGNKTALDYFSSEQREIFYSYKRLTEYKRHILNHRSSKNVEAVLSEVKPMVAIEVDYLDFDPYMLNTQTYAYDLRFGAEGRKEHRPEDFCTKICKYDPSSKGQAIWQEALDTFFCNDKDLISYAQDLMGAALFGKTSIEALIIAYGSGRNGKSSFFGAISQVLGNYSHTLSSDILTIGCKRNIKYEMAELRGKRLVLAGELEEKAKLNTSVLKQLTSVDSIAVERKYVSPYVIRPSHTLILHTNYKPEIKALDNGTWRRILLLPFHAQIASKNDIKNFGDILAEKAGEAILSWLIEGAKRMYNRNFQLNIPESVQEAINNYKAENDWLAPFLSQCCENDINGEGFQVITKDVYTAYYTFCLASNTLPHNKNELYSALETQGFRRFKKNNTFFFTGLRLKPGVSSDF